LADDDIRWIASDIETKCRSNLIYTKQFNPEELHISQQSKAQSHAHTGTKVTGKAQEIKKQWHMTG
jgi:hypothetical protein